MRSRFFRNENALSLRPFPGVPLRPGGLRLMFFFLFLRGEVTDEISAVLFCLGFRRINK